MITQNVVRGLSAPIESGLQAAREPEVGAQVNQYQGLNEQLSKAVESLRERLQSILPPTPSSGSVEKNPEEMLCPLAHELRVNNRSLQLSIEAIRELERSIEL